MKGGRPARRLEFSMSTHQRCTGHLPNSRPKMLLQVPEWAYVGFLFHCSLIPDDAALQRQLVDPALQDTGDPRFNAPIYADLFDDEEDAFSAMPKLLSSIL